MKEQTPTSTLVLGNIVAPIGLLLVLLATLAPFALMHKEWARTAYPFVYTAGAFVLLAARLFSHYPATDKRLRSLHRLEKWTPLLFCAGAFLLFYDPTTLRDWLAFTMAGAAVQIFTSIAIPMREAKLARGKADVK